MLVLRALSATGSAAMQSLGAGIIRDIVPPRYRGGYMGWYNAGIGVAIGKTSQCSSIQAPIVTLQLLGLF